MQGIPDLRCVTHELTKRDKFAFEDLPLSAVRASVLCLDEFENCIRRLTISPTSWHML